MGSVDPHRTAGGRAAAGFQKTSTGEATRGSRRGRGRAEAARGIGIGQDRRPLRGTDERPEAQGALVLQRLQGRHLHAVRRLVDLPVLRLSFPDHHVRGIALRGDGEEHGGDGIARFWVRVRHRVRVLLRAAPHDSWFHGAGIGLRIDSVRVLRVYGVGLPVLQILDRYVDYGDIADTGSNRCQRSRVLHHEVHRREFCHVDRFHIHLQGEEHAFTKLYQQYLKTSCYM